MNNTLTSPRVHATARPRKGGFVDLAVLLAFTMIVAWVLVF